MKKKFDHIGEVFQSKKKQLIQTMTAKALVSSFVLGSTFVVSSATMATPVNLNPVAPNVYVVKKGDTLWQIAGLFLQKPWLWPQIWVKNSHIKNPNLIYPNDRLLICKDQNNTLIGKDEGDGCTGVISRASALKTTEVLPRIRVQALSDAIPLIPLKDIQVWLNRATIVSAESIKNTPTVVGAENGRLASAVGQKVYVSGQGLEIGQRYAVYKTMQPYLLQRQDRTTLNAGTELIQTASGIVTDIQQGIASLELTKSFNEEVKQKDLVLPEQVTQLPTTFTPTPASVMEKGRIIRIAGSMANASKHSVVTINLGTYQGIEAGQVFDITQNGLKHGDLDKHVKQLPTEKVGQLMIFRTFNNVSYGYVLSSRTPIQLGATTQAPE
ncbi:LysM peptidoglycan-binding domain-containing protein [Acinetobacter rathckeae]|uniref:LysM peptidoglycan-binding domain-containing protein n=1 Tax=Acinetobacter rathckeae TaxID=2605272 RepID=UPI0018A2FDA8|nr:LysM peptidoglycan-binding domain-containing protein [Acinetobacter rathckeae]MBF7688760.1 LysM peptidoglycan-binding domain-containing protein [Acinetobacter rathckeae]MBF7696237.1 LysM peptidoglycan-binding domain-containing protein [Acinetobacter rathckeae]